MTRLQELFIKMLVIRKVEERIAKEYVHQEMRGPVHLSIGQEAAAVGICESLNKDDLMVSTHRGHAHYLAKGGNLDSFIAELYGKASGCSRGHGGSMHLVDWAAGFAGSTSIVGGTIPVGVGLSFAQKLRGDPSVTVVCFGDAAIEEGVFHESANFASLHRLPVIFVCENNLYSCFTHISERQPNRSMFHVAQAHDLKYLSASGNKVLGVIEAMNSLIGLAKAGEGPSFLELETYRKLEHCGPSSDDHLNYRSPAEVEKWAALDPVEIHKQILVEAREWSAEFEMSLFSIDKEIDKAFLFAKESPFPTEAKIEYAPT